jgi:hypothetical protein
MKISSDLYTSLAYNKYHSSWDISPKAETDNFAQDSKFAY